MNWTTKCSATVSFLPAIGVVLLTFGPVRVALGASGPADEVPGSGQAGRAHPGAQSRIDSHADPLPWGAMMRLGTVRFRADGVGRGTWFLGDGRVLASGAFDAIVLWNADTGKEIRRLGYGAYGGRVGTPWRVDFSPDGRTWAAQSHDGRTVVISQTSTGAHVASLDVEMDRHMYPGRSCLRYSPDGTALALTSALRSTIYEARTGRKVRAIRFKGPLPGTPAAGWSPDGTALAVCGGGPAVQVYDVTTGSLTRNCDQGKSASTYAVAFSPDGKMLASGGWNAISLWTFPGGKAIGKLEAKMEAVHTLVFTDAGQTLISGSQDGKARVWDLRARKPRRTFDARSQLGRSMAVTRDGATVALGTCDPVIRLWDVKTGRKRLPSFEGHDGEVLCVAYSPDGRTIASGGTRRQIRLWDAHLGKERQKLSRSADSLLFDPSGRRAASCWHYDGTISVWHATTGDELLKLSADEKQVREIGFTADGVHLVSVGSDSRAIWHSKPDKATLHVWDVASGAHLRAFEIHAASTESLALTADGRFAILGAADGTIQVRDVATGRRVLLLTAHKHSVSSLACSSDGRTLASGSFDQTIRLWDLTTWKPLRTLEGHTRAVTSVAFSPDGRLLASGSGDPRYPVVSDQPQKIRLWNVSTGKQIAHLEGHDSNVSSLAFSPDGARLVSGHRNSTVLVWSVTRAKG